MAVKRFRMLGLIPVALAGVAIAGVRSYCTRPCGLSGIPTRDYQYGSRSRSETALSRPPLHLKTTEDNRTIKEIRVYQFEPAKLTIDHCSISQMDLQLHDNGFWVMSLLAEQNPRTEGQGSPAVTPEGLFTAHLKRNQFVVKVRFYGGPAWNGTAADSAVGRPILFELEPMAFWVQSGRPRRYWKQGYIHCEQRLRDLVEGADLEFFYR
jgi:hypothetical protein